MKPPCVDCERHRFYKKELFDENPLTQHYCITKRRNRVTGFRDVMEEIANRLTAIMERDA